MGLVFRNYWSFIFTFFNNYYDLNISWSLESIIYKIVSDNFFTLDVIKKLKSLDSLTSFSLFYISLPETFIKINKFKYKNINNFLYNNYIILNKLNFLKYKLINY